MLWRSDEISSSLYSVLLLVENYSVCDEIFEGCDMEKLRGQKISRIMRCEYLKVLKRYFHGALKGEAQRRLHIRQRRIRSQKGSDHLRILLDSKPALLETMITCQGLFRLLSHR